MARRLALTVITLIMLLLALVAVPLGLLTADQDRHDFTDETNAAATTLASFAEENLSDRPASQQLAAAIAGLARDGDQVSVYNASGRWVAGTIPAPEVPPASLRRALRGTASSGYPSADRMLAVMPVSREAHRPAGAVALSRSTEALDHRVAVLWAWLAMVSAAGLIAAVLSATALARWVSRPVSALESATQRLGEGQLATRSPTAAGPREVRKLAINFNRMAARLEALVDGHQAMMADVSHQLRTPLAALRLRLDVLAQESPPLIAEELAGAQEEVARLSRMVDGLLAVARAEHAITAADAISVDAVIRDRAAAWRLAAEEKSVTLSAQISEPLTIRLGEGLLEQILDNLLANALEAVPHEGRISISGSRAGSRVQIVVADNGPGMSRPQRRAAFRRYVSATPGGTGLGLAIVHRMVTSGGGTAELSDTPGGGLTVTLDLPVGPPGPATRPVRRSGPTALADRAP